MLSTMCIYAIHVGMFCYIHTVKLNSYSVHAGLNQLSAFQILLVKYKLQSK